MKYIVIGLGNLGRAIAGNLAKIGNDVIGVDRNLNKVDAVKQLISGAICFDTTDLEALSSLPIKDVDAIIVTYGKDFGVSVQTVALLKTLGANKLIVREISSIHATVIRAIGVNEILTPEEDYAANYASRALLGNLFKQRYKVTETDHVFKIATPSVLVGQTLGDVNMKENFKLNLIAIERPVEERNMIGIKQMIPTVIDKLDPSVVFQKDDILILFGKMEDIHKIAEL